MSSNALTDVISNVVGIMVLLMLMVLLHPEATPEKELTPGEYLTYHSPSFFLVKDEAVLALDLEETFSRALRGVRSPNGLTEDEFVPLGYRGLYAKVDPARAVVLGVESTAEWDSVADLDNPRSALRLAVGALNADARFAYLFVFDAPASGRFEGARRLQDYLLSVGVKVGIAPVDDAHLPYLCNWRDEPRCDYRPSIVGAEAHENGSAI